MTKLDTYKETYKTLQQQWKKKDPELLVMGRLSYWTFWLSKMANTTTDKELANKLFEMKERSINLLIKSKYVQVRKYVPEISHKLCNKHYFGVGSNNVWHVLRQKKKNILECEQCKKGESNYYTLYSIALLDGVEDEKSPLYIMYLPYPKFKTQMPDLEELEQVKRDYVGFEYGKVEMKYNLTPNNLIQDGFSLKLIMSKFNKNYEEAEQFLMTKKAIS